MKIVGSVFFFIGFLTIFFGSWQIYEQYHKITTYHPVQARILSKKIKTIASADSDGKTSYTYKPMIKYSYKIKGSFYFSSQVTVLDSDGGSAWANRILTLYTGKKTIAYYDPKNPSKTFLLKHYDFDPYMISFIGLFILITGLHIFLSKNRFYEVFPKLRRGRNGGFRIFSVSHVKSNRIRSMIVGLVWLLVGALIFSHYFILANESIGYFEICSFLVYLFMFFAILQFFVKDWILEKNIQDAKIEIFHSNNYLGDLLQVDFTQQFFDHLSLEGLALGFICYKVEVVGSGKYQHTREISEYEEWIDLLEESQHSARKRISCKMDFHIPEEAPPSSPMKNHPNPFYVWTFQVKAKITNHPDYHSYFPIQIQNKT